MNTKIVVTEIRITQNTEAQIPKYKLWKYELQK